MKVKYLSLALLALLASCSEKQQVKEVGPINVEVEVAGASASFADKNYVGEVEAESSTAVSSLTPGTITKMYVEEGQNVGQGQTIATLDATQAQNALNSARALLSQAQDAYNRMSVLHEKKAISEIDWVGVQTKLQQAQSSVSMARKAVDDCVIKAPCSGVIGKKNIETGMTVLPSQPLCTILNINQVKVKVSVPEKELSIFKPNTRTKIAVQALGTSFNGGRVETGVQANSISRTYNVFINIPNGGRKLLPGMVCDVTVEGNQKQADSGSITLPVTAIHRRAVGDMFVWKANGGVANRVAVTVGATYGDRIEVTEGVAAGDKIITEGYQKLSEGSKINEKKN